MTYVPYTRQAVIGYDNVFTQGVTDASSSPSGGELENALDGFTFDFWTPVSQASPNYHWLAVALGAAAPVDYLAIHAHNLFTVGGTVALEGSDDGETWDEVLAPQSPASNGPMLWRFTQVNHAYYRLLMTGEGAALGVLQAGAALVLPEGVYVGMSPPPLNRANRIQNNKSEGGQFLGRSLIREGARALTMKQDFVTPAWVRSTWEAFAQHAETLPFFFAWRQGDYPLEVMYGWSVGDAEATQSRNAYMSVSLEIEGQVA